MKKFKIKKIKAGDKLKFSKDEKDKYNFPVKRIKELRR